jgi:hypothetical protein
MGRTVADTALAKWLDDELTKREWGVRTLARRINPDDPEIARRMLNRCLFDGSNPEEGNREAIAAGLNVPVSEVPGVPIPFGVRPRDVDVDAPLSRDELDMYMALHGRVARFGVATPEDARSL